MSHSRRKWRAAGGQRGTTFSFTLDRTARVRFRVTAKGRTAVTLVRSGKAGRNRVAFRGRAADGRALRPGRYSVTIVAIDPATGKRSKPRRLRFTVVR